MFRLRPEGRRTTVAVTVEGRPVMLPAGASAAAAVLAAGFDSIRARRRSRGVSGRPTA
jgi:hypothetical protein